MNINKPFVTIIGEERDKEIIGVTHYGYLIINVDWKKRIITMQEEKRKPVFQSIYEWVLEKLRINGGTILADKKSNIVYKVKDDSLYKVGHKDWKAGRTNTNDKSYEN